MNVFDHLAALALRLAPSRYAVFPDGWGAADLEALIASGPEPETPIPELELEWVVSEELEDRERSRAEFVSPWSSELPDGAARCYVERTTPKGGTDRTVVLLQMWGDEGFSMRRPLADHLAKRGIASVLPIHPFYGRRRAHAEGAALRTVEDFLRLGLGTIHETRTLLGSLRHESIVGLGGFSMGAGLSVGTSMTIPFPAALGLAGAAPSPANAFTTGVLRRGLPATFKDGSARDQLAHLLNSFGALHRPVLDHHRSAVILAAQGDGFVPVEDAIALSEHWQGAELRLVRGGHATLWFRGMHHTVAAIERAFERHEASVASRSLITE